MIALVFLWHWKRVRQGWQRGARIHQFECEQRGDRVLGLITEIAHKLEVAEVATVTAHTYTGPPAEARLIVPPGNRTTRILPAAPVRKHILWYES